MAADIFPITMPEGPGAVLTATISGILPDRDKRKKNWALMFTEGFPDGISVQGTPESLIAEWEVRLIALDLDEDDWSELFVDDDEAETPEEVEQCG